MVLTSGGVAGAPSGPVGPTDAGRADARPGSGPGRGSNGSRRGPGVPALALLVGAAAVLPFVVVAGVLAAKTWMPVSDNTLIATKAAQIPGTWPTTGAYSRFGFDHPGPLESYLLAITAKPLGTPGLLWTVAVTNAAAVLGCLLVAWRRGGARLLALAAVVLAVLAHSLAGALADPWNPFVPLLPFCFCILAAWSVWCRDWAFTPALALAASYVAQAHVGYLPLVAVLAGASTAWVGYRWWRRRRGRPGPSGWVVWSSLAVLAVVWFAPLAQQLTADDGNLGAIATYFTNPAPARTAEGEAKRQRPSSDHVVAVTAGAYALPAPWVTGSEEIVPFVGDVVGVSWWHLLLPLAAFVAAAAWGWRRHCFEAMRLQAIVVVMAAVGLFCLFRITGNVFPYIVRWQWGLGALLWLSVAWTALSAWQAGGRAASLGPARSRRLDQWLLATAAAISVVLAASLVHAMPPDPLEGATAASIVDQVAAAVPPGTDVRLEAGPGRADLVTGGVIAELVRRGVPVVALPADDTRFGLPRIDATARHANIRIVVDDDVEVPPRPGEVAVGSFDPMTDAERAELRGFTQRGMQAMDRLRAGQPAGDLLTEAEGERWEELRSVPPRATMWRTEVG